MATIPSRRLRGWKLALFVASIAVLLLFSLIALPFVIAEPFERVVDEARAKGIPGSYAEAGRRQDARRQRITNEMASLLAAVSLYEFGRPDPMMRTAVHPERVRLYREVPTATVQRALASTHELRAIDWSPRPGRWDRGEHALATKLIPLLCDRWLVEQFEDPDAEAALLIELARSFDPLWGDWRRIPVLLALRPRLADLRDKEALADRLRRFADERRPEFIHAAEARFAQLAEFLRRPEEEAKDRGLSLPRIADGPSRLHALVRLGGAEVLRHGIRSIEGVRTMRDPVVLEAHLKASIPTEISAGRILHGMAGAWESHFLQSAVHVEMLARTLAWRLDGKEHPIDQWDPAKRPLRSLERDGRIVALYSVGHDGHDHGGVAGKDL
ncbi:MAG TPA: hypothetical protein VEZ12_22355, partial [Herpetosiphonaceae bacterium]|nr:hypothetical protein [Herpetosiphonaceae bacterium]